MSDPEFLEKRLLREMLRHKLMPDYEPSKDDFLEYLNEIFNFMIAAEKSNYFRNARNFILKLADNDPAWRSRILCFCWLIKENPIKFKAHEIEWCKAHIARPFFE